MSVSYVQSSDLTFKYIMRWSPWQAWSLSPYQITYIVIDYIPFVIYYKPVTSLEAYI